MSALADIERAALGAMLLSPKVAIPVASIDERLVPEDFESLTRGRIFAALLELDEKEAADSRMLRDRLGGDEEARLELDYVLGPQVQSPGNLRAYVRRIREGATTRRAMRAAREVLELAGRGVVGDDLVAAGLELFDGAAIGEGQASREEHLNDILERVVDRADSASRDQKEVGIPTGFRDLDEHTGGLRPGQVWIIGGRPAMGKSTLCMNIATNVAGAGYPTAIFPLEMSADELGERVIASTGKVNLTEMRTGRLLPNGRQRMRNTSEKLRDLPLWIDATSDVSIIELRAKVRRLVRRHALQVVVVDYAQQIRRNPKLGQTEALGEISRGLKTLAMELDVTVIVAAQLNRQLEGRGTSIDSKRPQLSDLRGSGDFEQDADVVMFPFRREYYVRQAGEEPLLEDRDTAELIVAKFRNGEPIDLPLVFLGVYSLFGTPADRQAA
ncbi:MAG: replicative DNA helicase [Patulibacter minatonensis]